jgi:hypothetical protein
MIQMSLLPPEPKCAHKTVRFGSGAFYIFCSDCLQRWVAVKATDNEIDYEEGSNPLSGQERKQ